MASPAFLKDNALAQPDNNIGGAGAEADQGLATAAVVQVRAFDVKGWQESNLDQGVNAMLDTLRTDGVVVLRGVYTPEQLAEFRVSYDDCWHKTRGLMTAPDSEPWQRRLFHRMGGPNGSKTAALDKTLYHGVATKVLPNKVLTGDVQAADVKGAFGEKSIVTRMGPGRYDFTHGMEYTVLGTDTHMRPQPVNTILRHFLGPESEWHSYPGGLPAEGPTGPGRWHRDTYSLWEDEGTNDRDVSPWYFTHLAPLTHVGNDDGPTQFRLGSHLLPVDKVGGAPLAYMELEPGDACLFDGRIVHRGGPRAKSAGGRHVLYTVHHKWWFTDDDMGPPVAKIENLPEKDVAKIEMEEPWLVQRHYSVNERAMMGIKKLSAKPVVTISIGIALGAWLGYFGRSHKQ